MTVLSEAIWQGDMFQPSTASVTDYSFPRVQISTRSSTTLFSREDLTDDARELLSKIRSFAALNANWDSYGAEPPSKATIDNAFSLVKILDRHRAPVYFTAPGPNGEVLIELKDGNKSIEITFEPDGTSIYAKFDGDNCVEENNFRDEEASELIQWFAS